MPVFLHHDVLVCPAFCKLRVVPGAFRSARMGRAGETGENCMNKHRLKWDDLRIFLEVARQGSIHGAAKALGLDHSTVGRRIDRLEQTRGVKLLDRSRRGVSLRDEALSLVQHVERMDAHAASVEDAIIHGGEDAGQIVRIATMEGLASRYLAPRLPQLAAFAPNVTVELVSVPQIVDLTRKEADIFLSFFDPGLAGLASERIAGFKLFVYGSRDYLARHSAPQSRDDLKAHKFVTYVEDMLAIDAVRWLDEVIVDPQVSFYSNSVIAQSAAVVEGMGLALLPVFVMSGVDGVVRVLPDEVCVERDVWVSVRIEHAHLSRIGAVMKFLARIFERDGDFLDGGSTSGGDDDDTGQANS